MIFNRMKSKRLKMVASLKAMNQKKCKLETQIEMLQIDLSELEAHMAPLCDHDWVWSIRHKMVDKCAVCQTRRMIYNRPKKFKIRVGDL